LMEFTNYYTTLGISRDAGHDEITKAFRKLARKYHPDVNKAPDAEALFKEIGEAFGVLKDPEKRARYDRYGAAWNQARQGAGPFGFEDVRYEDGAGGARTYAFGGEHFGSFYDVLERMSSGRASVAGESSGFRRQGFGFAGEGNGAGTSTGQDQEAVLSVSLEEAAAGGVHTVTLPEPGSANTRRYRVTVPPGVTEGKRIRLAGEGGRSAGRRSGDLYLRVSLRKHPRLRLNGSDLHTTVDMPAWQAALGGKVRLKTLDQTVQVGIPPGSSSGRRIRLKGKGYPLDGKPGDLYAEVQIVVPEQLTKREEALYRELSGFDGGRLSAEQKEVDGNGHE